MRPVRQRAVLLLLFLAACARVPPQDDPCAAAMDAAQKEYVRCIVDAAHKGAVP